MSQVHDVNPDATSGLKGIGGWLILLAVGQVLGPFQILYGMFTEYGGLPDGTMARMPMAFLGDIVLRLAYVGLLIYSAYLFFNTSARFPSVFIATYVAGLILPFALGIWVTLMSGVNTLANLSTGSFFWSYGSVIVIGGLWVAYILNSERVKNTFVD